MKKGIVCQGDFGTRSYVCVGGVSRIGEFSGQRWCAKYIFYSFARSRQGAWGRAVVAFLGKKWGGYQLKRFAEHFKRDPVVMSKGVRGVEKKLAEEKAFARSIERMEKNLIQNKKPKIVN